LELSQDGCRSLGGDARFLASKEVDDFLSETQNSINQLRNKMNTYLDEERRSKRRDSANTLLSHAKTYFTSHMYARSFGYLQEGRDVIAEIEIELSSLDHSEDRSFISDWNSRASEFEAVCQKTLFEEEVKSLLQSPAIHLNTCEFYLQTGNYEQVRL